jgi:hypothetical protein
MSELALANDLQVSQLTKLCGLEMGQAQKTTRKEAERMIQQAKIKYYQQKLVEWGIKTEAEVMRMLHGELYREFIFCERIVKTNTINAIVGSFKIGERVIYIGNKEPCTIIAIRRQTPDLRKVQHFTVQFDDGRKKAVDYSGIKKIS